MWGENVEGWEICTTVYERWLMPPEEDEYPPGDFDPEHPPRDPEEDD